MSDGRAFLTNTSPPPLPAGPPPSLVRDRCEHRERVLVGLSDATAKASGHGSLQVTSQLGTVVDVDPSATVEVVDIARQSRVEHRMDRDADERWTSQRGIGSTSTPNSHLCEVVATHAKEPSYFLKAAGMPIRLCRLEDLNEVLRIAIWVYLLALALHRDTRRRAQVSELVVFVLIRDIGQGHAHDLLEKILGRSEGQFLFTGTPQVPLRSADHCRTLALEVPAANERVTDWRLGEGNPNQLRLGRRDRHHA